MENGSILESGPGVESVGRIRSASEDTESKQESCDSVSSEHRLVLGLCTHAPPRCS